MLSGLLFPAMGDSSAIINRELPIWISAWPMPPPGLLSRSNSCAPKALIELDGGIGVLKSQVGSNGVVPVWNRLHSRHR